MNNSLLKQPDKDIMADYAEMWEIKKLKDLTSIRISNGAFNDPNKTGNGYKLINVKNLYNEPHINASGLSLLNISEKEFERYKVKKGDLFFTRSSLKAEGIAHCNIFTEIPDDIIYECHIMRIRPDEEIIDPFYLFHFCKSFHARKYFIRHSKVATMTTIDQNDLGNLPVLLPPIPEQKAIADLLSTWDDAIEKTERLIEAKGNVFKKLINDLIYIPTVNGKWEELKMKFLFSERKESKRDDLPLLAITENEGIIPRENTNRKDTSNKDKSKYLRICPGDIGYNTMRMWQGVSALSMFEGIISPAYTVCIPGKKLSPQFISYLFKTPFMIHRFYRYSQGLTSDTWNLKYSNFCEIKMPLPSLPEQQQIAETLSTAQQEIDLLKKLAEKYKEQKRGLMQKLLTGEWRVKSEILNQYKGA
ncbi:restriction endonuclease subunit S [Methanoplanus endosymbiosus]|uniref:Restriction endonuclease subunit S n=1 Tax=Methanoplanus endosymbiosus TaxID=33865 RepID=A0A9E7TJM2_9EURY|nr:restriction endonuclease subunit S [Methanoplanus endosymbiosus]UUX93808.1 restriction endonuclease subunit S [Methanoplanus endosymbiosus]